MLALEDLFVANLLAKRNLMQVEHLRKLLGRLDARPERVQLVRYLHEGKAIAFEQAKLVHDMAQVYLRRRSEDAYSVLLRRTGAVPAHVVEALALEQAQGGYQWGLGEKLTQENALSAEQHQSIQQEVLRVLESEEQRMLTQNRESQFAPVLGPPQGGARTTRAHVVAGSSPDARLTQSGQDARLTQSGQDARLTQSSPDASGRRTRAHQIPSPPPPPQAGDQPVLDKTVRLSSSDEARTVRLSGGGLADSDRTVKMPPPGADATDTFPAVETPPAETEGRSTTIKMQPSDVILPPGAPVPGGDPFATVTFNPGEGLAGESNLDIPNIRMGGKSPTLKVGDTLQGKYTIEGELGRGAMGIVYDACDVQSGRRLAVKVVQGMNQDAHARFQREIKVSRAAHHEHVIEVLDAGELKDGSNYMVMEFLDGESLQGILLREGAQEIERALDLLEQLLQGLAAMHAKEIVHRDLKPENLQVVQVDGKDRIKIMDFGVSRFLGQAADDEKMFVTMRGQLSGTPVYVAPEAVLEPELVLTAHDIYACGVIFYELLTGSLPFVQARTLRDILADTVHSRPRPLEEANPERAPYPEPVEQLARRLLEKDPEVRPSTGAAALEALAETRVALTTKQKEESAGFTARWIRKITGLFKRKGET